MTAGSFVSSQLAVPQERAAERPGMLDQQQAEVFQTAMGLSGEKVLEDMFKQTLRKDREQKIHLDHVVITNITKVALIDALSQSPNFRITRHGNLLDLFLTGPAVKNWNCASIILRMVFIMPAHLPCVEKLKENLLAYCELLGGRGMWICLFCSLSGFACFQV